MFSKFNIWSTENIGNLKSFFKFLNFTALENYFKPIVKKKTN